MHFSALPHHSEFNFAKFSTCSCLELPCQSLTSFSPFCLLATLVPLAPLAPLFLKTHLLGRHRKHQRQLPHLSRLLLHGDMLLHRDFLGAG
jgi:hypothetical protein